MQLNIQKSRQPIKPTLLRSDPDENEEYDQILDTKLFDGAYTVRDNEHRITSNIDSLCGGSKNL